MNWETHELFFWYKNLIVTLCGDSTLHSRKLSFCSLITKDTTIKTQAQVLCFEENSQEPGRYWVNLKMPLQCLLSFLL